MNINAYLEVTGNELEMLATLLSKELEDARTAIHHSKNHEYKELLKDRERQLLALIGRIEDASRVRI
jgi:hypothetical protein